LVLCLVSDRATKPTKGLIHTANQCGQRASGVLTLFLRVSDIGTQEYSVNISTPIVQHRRDGTAIPGSPELDRMIHVTQLDIDFHGNVAKIWLRCLVCLIELVFDDTKCVHTVSLVGNSLELVVDKRRLSIVDEYDQTGRELLGFLEAALEGLELVS